MFYKLDSTRLTLREYAWLSPRLLLPIHVLLKLLRIRLALPGVIPHSSAPFLVNPADIPDEVKAKVQPLEEQMRECGFVDPAYHWIVEPFGSTRVCVVTLRHQSGTTMGRVIYCQVSCRQPPAETLYPAFLTVYQDGSAFVSTAGRRDVLGPPTNKIQRVLGASTPDLWRLHSQQVGLESLGKTIARMDCQEEMLKLADRHEAIHRDFQIQRGVYVPRDEADHKAIEAVMATPGSDEDRTFAAVYGEMERLVNRKAGWAGGILLLLASLAAFLALSWIRLDGSTLLLLLGVLLFHEMGHLAAMAAFRYRNLRMFFIPFLGAIITGQNYNVPAWKKAIVLLAGPLPGLLLGVVLCVVAVLYQWQALFLASFLLIGLNAFNLMPFTPLDGGQLLEVLLFSRHPLLNAVFQVLGAVLLVLISLATSKALAILGVLMLIGLPASYRVAKAVRRLRQGGMDATSPDARTVPVETARRIYDELRQVFPSRPAAKVSARWTLHAFELLNSAPPRWPATAALLGVHALSVAAVVAVVLVLLFPWRWGLPGLARSEPRYKLQQGSVQAWEGAKARQTMRSQASILIADFPSQRAAEDAHRDISATLPACAIATVFGQTLMVTLPAEDDEACRHWRAELNARCRNVSVLRFGVPVFCRMTCRVPNDEAAQRLLDQAEVYLSLPPRMHLVPPWFPEQQISDRHHKARRTYLEILKQQSARLQDERWKTQCRKQWEAERRGDATALKQLAQELSQLDADLKREYVERWRKQAGGEWDLAVIEQYEKLPEPQWSDMPDGDEDEGNDPLVAAAMRRHEQAYQRWAVEFGSRLGQLPLDQGTPSPEADRYSAQGGNVVREGNVLHFYVAFLRPAAGVPALADWLFEHGCADIRYEFPEVERARRLPSGAAPAEQD